MVRVFSPGSIGNLGPGFDVLGLAVAELGDYVTMELADHDAITVRGRDADVIPTDPDENTVSLAARALFESCDCQHRIKVDIERYLPSSGGLGASAASSVAGALAAASLIGRGEDSASIMAAALVADMLWTAAA